MTEGILLSRQVTITGRVEIARSFSYKLNAGQYESRDFFCSQKVECDAADAEEISELVYQFCKRQVLHSVEQYRRETAEKFGPQTQRRAV